MKTSDLMEELYLIRSILIAGDMANIHKEESAKNSYHDRRWSAADASNVTDVATKLLEQLLDRVDRDSLNE